MNFRAEDYYRAGVERMRQAGALYKAGGSYAFASEDRVRAFLRQIDRLQGIKGNPLKKNALDLLRAAQMIVDRGETLWTSGKK